MSLRPLHKLIAHIKRFFSYIFSYPNPVLIWLVYLLLFIKQITVKNLTEAFESFKLTYKQYVKIIKDSYFALKKRLSAILDYIENAFNKLKVIRVYFQDWYESEITRGPYRFLKFIHKIIRWLAKIFKRF